MVIKIRLNTWLGNVFSAPLCIKLLKMDDMHSFYMINVLTKIINE